MTTMEAGVTTMDTSVPLQQQQHEQEDEPGSEQHGKMQLDSLHGSKVPSPVITPTSRVMPPPIPAAYASHSHTPNSRAPSKSHPPPIPPDYHSGSATPSPISSPAISPAISPKHQASAAHHEGASTTPPTPFVPDVSVTTSHPPQLHHINASSQNTPTSASTSTLPSPQPGRVSSSIAEMMARVVLHSPHDGRTPISATPKNKLSADVAAMSISEESESNPVPLIPIKRARIHRPVRHAVVHNTFVQPEAPTNNMEQIQPQVVSNSGFRSRSSSNPDTSNHGLAHLSVTSPVSGQVEHINCTHLNSPIHSEQHSAYMRTLQTPLMILKHGRSGKPSCRFLHMNDDYALVFAPPSVAPQSNHILNGLTIKSITRGKATAPLKRSIAASVPEDRCFSIVARERELNVQFPSSETCESWYVALLYIHSTIGAGKEKALERVVQRL